MSDRPVLSFRHHRESGAHLNVEIDIDVSGVLHTAAALEAWAALAAAAAEAGWRVRETPASAADWLNNLRTRNYRPAFIERLSRADMPLYVDSLGVSTRLPLAFEMLTIARRSGLAVNAVELLDWVLAPVGDARSTVTMDSLRGTPFEPAVLRLTHEISAALAWSPARLVAARAHRPPFAAAAAQR